METAVLMDVDATLTPPRQPLNEEVANVLKHINIPFYLVAGSHLSILQKQFFEPLYKFGFRKQFETFISNGAILYRCDYSSGISVNLVSEFNFREYLGDKDYNFLVNVLEKTLKTGEFKMPNSIKIIGNRIVDRVSMINFINVIMTDIAGADMSLKSIADQDTITVSGDTSTINASIRLCASSTKWYASVVAVSARITVST